MQGTIGSTLSETNDYEVEERHLHNGRNFAHWATTTAKKPHFQAFRALNCFPGCFALVFFSWRECAAFALFAARGILFCCCFCFLVEPPVYNSRQQERNLIRNKSSGILSGTARGHIFTTHQHVAYGKTRLPGYLFLFYSCS